MLISAVRNYILGQKEPPDRAALWFCRDHCTKPRKACFEVAEPFEAPIYNQMQRVPLALQQQRLHRDPKR
jgi:hypothetical protein